MTEPSAEKSAAPDRRVDVVLAEFSALRTEMITRTTIQATLIGTGIAAIGLIIGFVVSDHASSTLLVFVPVLATGILLLFVAESYRIIQLGDYIGTEQYEYLCKVTNDKLPSWERKVFHRSEYRPGLVVSLLDAPVDVLLIVASIASAWMADGVAIGLRIMSVVFVGLAALLHLSVGYRGKLFARVRTTAAGPGALATPRRERGRAGGAAG